MVDVGKREDRLLDALSQAIAERDALRAENTQLREELMIAVEAALIR